MFGAPRTAPLSRAGPRPLPIAFSLVAHGALLALVALGGPSVGSRKPRSLYEQVIKPHERELVWYSFKKKLPEVAPPEMENQQPPGAEFKLPDQTIISQPKQAERGSQMIWRPAPQIKPQLEVPSPNILAFRMPAIAPPPPGPPRKVLIPPAPKPKEPPKPAPAMTEPPKVWASVAPKLNPALIADLNAALSHRLKPRPFVPPVPVVERRAAAPALPEAPGVASTLRSERVPLLAESMAAALANTPQARRFIPPPARERTASGPATLPDGPKVAPQSANANGAGRVPGLAESTAAALANQPRARAFVPPSTQPGGKPGSHGTASVPIIEDAPTVNGGMASGNVSVAVVGLNPAMKLSGPLPESSREARFSAGPNANGGSGGGASHGTALSVPGLLISGGSTPPGNATVANPLLVARAAPTSRATLEAAAKLANATSPAGADAAPDPTPVDIHLSPPPDEEFTGRDVYTLAVQMPNISSYLGSWIMWFAERGPSRPRSNRGLRPPVPIHKVDPKYYQSAIAERVEGRVQIAGVIRANGHVEMLRVLKGVDSRLDQSAAEALMKWEFEPAERNGAPVEVDLVAEIPFVLAPQVRR